MKKLLIILSCFLGTIHVFSQSVGVGTTTPNASAKLDVSSTNQGFLMPRLSTAQRKAIANPAAGLMVFDLEKNTLYMYDGANWSPLSFVPETALPAVSRYANDAHQNQQFGYSVAISGNYAVVGAPEDSTGGIYSRGAAYVFFRSNNTWVQQAKLLCADPASNDGFGASVAIDGDYAVIGAIYKIDGTHTGCAYVFTRNGSSWTQQVKLSVPEAGNTELFGNAVAIGGDNIIIGACNLMVNGHVSQGGAYTFKRTGNNWSFVNKLFAGDGAAYDYYASSISISGSYAVIGAPQKQIGPHLNSGQVYVYVQGGGTWTYQTSITGYPSDGKPYFGTSVAVSGDYIAAGAPGYDLGSIEDVGAVIVFKRNGSTWQETGTYFSNETVSGMGFGKKVAISGDYWLAGTGNGQAAYVYKKANNETWSQYRRVTEPADQGTFGFTFSVAMQGFNLVIGNPYISTAAPGSAGAAYFLNFQY